jgi:phosphoglycolate phosphatase
VAANHEILALFDLDGTLVRAGDEVHHAAFEHACRVVFGAEVTVRSFELGGAVDRGLYDTAAAGLGMDPARAAQRFAEWAAIVGRYYTRRVGGDDRVGWVLPGVSEVLRKLRATGIAMAVATGSARAVGETKLAASGLADYFRAGAYGDEGPDRVSLLRRAVEDAGLRYGRRFLAANAVVIGDTPADIKAAREIGARTIAVATGKYPADELDSLGPDATFADLTNADAVVRVIKDPTTLS